MTQRPLITVSKGETAELDCNLGTVTDKSARWYKQTPGGVPQHVLRFIMIGAQSNMDLVSLLLNSHILVITYNNTFISIRLSLQQLITLNLDCLWCLC